MGFNAGGQTYQGGSYLYGGLSNLGKGVSGGIADAMQKFDENRRLESYNDTVVQHALNAGQITHEDFDKYRGMSRTQKTGFAAGIAANFLQDYKQEQLASSREQRLATAEERRQRAAALSWTPDEAAREAARWTNNELIQVGPGRFQPVPYGETAGAEGEPQVRPLTDPSTGKAIPGFGIVTKPGSKQFQVVPFATGGVQIEMDPQTGTPFYRDIKGNPHPLTGQQIMAGQMMPNAAGAAPEQPSGPSAIDQIWNYISALKPGRQSSSERHAAANRAVIPNFGQAPGDENATGVAAELAPSPAGGGEAKPDLRQQAIQILQSANKPVTEANIQAVIKKLDTQSRK
jgi:hypothetical protein